jgi:predicted ATPase
MAPSRHCTVLATMDWSHDPLPEKEKILYHRLSVFSGGFNLEAAEAVCCGGEV